MPSKGLTAHRSPASALPEGRRIYAIGDCHGCADRLARLHASVHADLAARPIANPVLIHLGDYVDRGPDSAGVLDLLGQPRPGLPTINLLGNHDDMMLAALAPDASAEAVALWLANGGAATLASYGATPRDRRSWRRIPDRHLDLLRSCPVRHAEGGYFFVHAGIRPELPLDRQARLDLLWIREPFLSWKDPLPAVIVHGHTPTARPEIGAFRIGLDTGAVFGGDLTCAWLERDQIGFFRS